MSSHCGHSSGARAAGQVTAPALLETLELLERVEAVLVHPEITGKPGWEETPAASAGHSITASSIFLLLLLLYLHPFTISQVTSL